MTNKTNDYQVLLLRAAIAIGLLMAPMLALGHLYGSLADVAEWRLEPSRLGCKLTQPLPSYGRAVFYRRAGKPMEFYLDSQRKVKFGGEAKIFSAAPAWMHTKPVIPLGNVPVHNGFRPITVQHNLASLIMAELQRGRIAVVEHLGWYSTHKIEVEVSSINFTDAYQGFVSCLSDLVPANFDQLRKSTFLYDSGSHSLKDLYIERIRLISQYIDADKMVEKIYIDGHSDNRGRSGKNWDISRQRAEEVKEIMLREGIPEELIVLRYHGENYPAVSNNSRKNRARNRRVTLRMEKASR